MAEGWKVSGTLEVRHAFCQMCGPAKTSCSMLCYLRDGVWEHVEGNPAAANNGGRGGRTLCAKANASMQVVNTPTRILYPMKRTGQKGEGKFQRISWDEALDTIAQTLLSQKEQFGAQSFGILSPQYFPVLGTFGRRFLNVHGSPNYLHSGICHGQRVFSNLVTLGGRDHLNAIWPMPGPVRQMKLIVNWGANCEASGANQGGPSDVLDALESGSQLIDIRPMREPLAARADLWLPVRPGTDCALAMGILNIIIQDALYDADFVSRWCSGFADLTESVSHCTPEWTSRQTGVPAELVSEAAKLMATVKPMGIKMGNGVGDQSVDGHWTVACIDLIVAITGNLGVADAAGQTGAKVPRKASAQAASLRLAPFDVLSSRLPASAEDVANGWMPGVSHLVAPETPRWFQTPQTQESGPTSAYFRALMSVLTDEPNRLHAVFAQATNPLSATRQPKLVEKALRALDFFFVMDTEWNPACDFADIVLPARTGYESDDLIACRQTPQGTWFGLSQQVAKPVGEARSDAQFYLDLACRMGYGADFWDGSMDAYLESRLEGTGVSLARLRECGQVVVSGNVTETPAVANGGIAEAPVAQGRGETAEAVVAETSVVQELGGTPGNAASRTPADAAEPCLGHPDYVRLLASLPGGKVQCRNDILAGKLANDDVSLLSGLPAYRGPAENPVGTPDLAGEYPLVFSDVHADILSEHSYYGNVPLLRELEPYPWVRINPRTAEAYGIVDGDWVRVESPHGWVKLQASYFEGIAPDVLMARRGWWQGCADLGIPGFGYLDGSCETNGLYDASPRSFNPFTAAMSKQTLVKICKTEPPAGLADGQVGQLAAPWVRKTGEPKAPWVQKNASLRGMRRHGAVQVPEAPGQPAAAPVRMPAGGMFAALRPAKPAPVRQGAIVFDAARCIGCQACEVACKQWNGIPATQPAYRWVVERDRGEFPDVKRTFLSESCHQCVYPACVAACPRRAITRDGATGLVRIDAAACVGCGACVDACPWHIPAKRADGTMGKCDGCATCGLTPEGLPHCVATCPMQALRMQW